MIFKTKLNKITLLSIFKTIQVLNVSSRLGVSFLFHSSIELILVVKKLKN